MDKDVKFQIPMYLPFQGGGAKRRGIKKYLNKLTGKIKIIRIIEISNPPISPPASPRNRDRQVRRGIKKPPLPHKSLN